MPKDWKEANVVPMSQISKIFEAVVRDEIVKFFDKYEMINDAHHGFRKGRSCLTNLLLFLDQVLKSVDKGHCMDVVFLDLVKAFDKVSHLRLLEKLKKHGINGKLLRVVGDVLSNRRQRVCIKGKHIRGKKI